MLPEKLVTFSFLNLRISIHRTKMSYRSRLRNYHPLHRLMCLRGGRKEGRKEEEGRKEGKKEGKKEGRKEKRKEGWGISDSVPY